MSANGGLAVCIDGWAFHFDRLKSCLRIIILASCMCVVGPTAMHAAKRAPKYAPVGSNRPSLLM